MHLPWKKSKPSRISRFFSDLQSLPKRRESLVVETGFPTSLVDIFVKNRDRLKKSSNVNKIHKKTRHGIPQSSFQIPENAISSQDLAPEPSVLFENGTVPQNPQIDDGEIVNFGETNISVVDEHGIWKFDALFFAAMKMFLVAIFALVTKKLALGITVSACVLLITEFVLCTTRSSDSIIGKCWIRAREMKTDEMNDSASESISFATSEDQEEIDDGDGDVKPLNSKAKSGLRLSKVKSGHLIMLLIVLAGLVGGKILAFGLTMAGFFIMLRSLNCKQ